MDKASHDSSIDRKTPRRLESQIEMLVLSSLIGGRFDDGGTGSSTNDASSFGDSEFAQTFVVVALSQYRELHEARQPRGVLGRSEPTITNQ